MMFSSIQPTGSYPPSGPSKHGLSLSTTGQIKQAAQNYDQFHRSVPPDGEESRIRETVSHISQSIRVRPTCHEIASLQQQVQDGSYQASPREIAARMLLVSQQEDG